MSEQITPPRARVRDGEVDVGDTVHFIDGFGILCHGEVVGIYERHFTVRSGAIQFPVEHKRGREFRKDPSWLNVRVQAERVFGGLLTVALVLLIIVAVSYLAGYGWRLAQ